MADQSVSRCRIIGEVAQAHDGSLGLAHSFIDAIADAGADAVKFQTHIASAESTPAEPWRVPFSKQDDSRYEYWKRMEFSEAQWEELKDHAADRGLEFLSSPFSQEAFELLERIGVSAWKVASGELSNLRLLDSMVASGKPILLSTGMSTLDEIDVAVERAQSRGASVTVLQCTSMYPCPPEKVGLHYLPFFRERYRCDVGLSDHTGTIFAALAAALGGASVVELHVTLSREMGGPDVSSSVTTNELRMVVDGVRFIDRLSSRPRKDDIAAELSEMKRIFGKSLVAGTDLSEGTVLSEKDLVAKKPGTGIPPDELRRVVGRRLRRGISADELLSERDLI